MSEYSKGMKSRLNFIKALLHSPKLLFLDEPTSGLDPSNARVMKDMILAEKAAGQTVILTTHNMYDAAELCDRVSFIVDGANPRAGHAQSADDTESRNGAHLRLPLNGRQAYGAHRGAGSNGRGRNPATAGGRKQAGFHPFRRADA